MMNIRNEAADGAFLLMAVQAAQESWDPSTKVGGLMLLPDGTHVTGFNTFMTLTHEEVQTVSREERYADVLHAEDSLCLRLGLEKTTGAWYYGTHEPCGRCWALLAKMGVTRVVFLATDDERRSRWGCDGPLGLRGWQAIQVREGIRKMTRAELGL